MKIQLLDPTYLPEYQTDDAAGFDIKSIETVILQPGERALVNTGLKMAIPSGYEVQIRPRSGLALRDGITVVNSPGTIDADYRGEIGVILINHSDEQKKISKGDRIAQGVLAAVFRANFVVTEELNETTRANGGFGSTGN